LSRKPAAPARSAGQQLVVVEGGEGQHGRRVGVPPDPARRPDTVDPPHPEVHHDHVGIVRRNGTLHLLAVRALADHDETVLGAQDPLKTGADEVLVVDEQHPHRLHRHVGSVLGRCRTRDSEQSPSTSAFGWGARGPGS
jgi:hypothetical protein